MNIGKTETWMTYKLTNHIGWSPPLVSFRFLVAVFNKEIKTRFPILFKRALDFYLMKAKGEFKVVI